MKIQVPKTVPEWNARGKEYLPGHLHFEITRVEPDEIVARFQVEKHLMAWNGFLHAGSIVTLADTCCGYGTVNSLPSGADGFATLDLSSNFVGTAREGMVICVATPVHRGRTTQVWDATVTSEESGKVIAKFRCTQLVIWPRQ